MAGPAASERAGWWWVLTRSCLIQAFVFPAAPVSSRALYPPTLQPPSQVLGPSGQWGPQLWFSDLLKPGSSRAFPSFVGFTVSAAAGLAAGLAAGSCDRGTEVVLTSLLPLSPFCCQVSPLHPRWRSPAAGGERLGAAPLSTPGESTVERPANRSS